MIEYGVLIQAVIEAARDLPTSKCSPELIRALDELDVYEMEVGV